MANPVNMLCLTKYTVSGPSSRYRVHQFLPYLRAAGIRVDVQSLHDERYLELLQRGDRVSSTYLVSRGLRRAAKILSARKYDLIMVQKEIFPHAPAVAERMLGATRAKLVVDIDDAVFTLYGTGSNGQWWDKMRGTYSGLLRRASLVLAGNTYLKAYAEQYSDNVVFFPTVVDTDRLCPVERADEDHVPVIGWIGSPATSKYLPVLVPILERLAKSARFRCVLVGTSALDVNGVAVHAKPWREAEEIADLAGFDIGLMPQDSSEWAKGKCGLKLLQYMAMGVPSVSSPSGGAGEIVTDGENGFLARTPGEWHDKLLCLLRDRDVRRDVGERGRRWVESHYNLRRYGPILASHLTTLAAGPRRAPRRRQ